MHPALNFLEHLHCFFPTPACCPVTTIVCTTMYSVYLLSFNQIWSRSRSVPQDYDQLFGFGGVELQTIAVTPVNQILYQMSILLPLIVSDTLHNVNCKLLDRSTEL